MGILKNSFSKLNQSEIDMLNEYFKGFDYKGAGYTFRANYIWRNTHFINWEIINDYLFISGGNGRNTMIAMPLTRDGVYEKETLRDAVLKVRKRFEENDLEFIIELVPEHMVKILEDIFPEQLNVTEDEDMAEYIYLKEKMITLSGRALHKKKNHMNYFMNNHKYEVRNINEANEEEILEIVNKIKSDKETKGIDLRSLHQEEEAVKEFLKFAGEEGFYSIGIYIDNKLEAFALGERINDDTVVEHFEKANSNYRGLYQVICSEFCKNLPEEIVYINREEDMGMENLRKAKIALKPVHMERRYTIDFC